MNDVKRIIVRGKPIAGLRAVLGVVDRAAAGNR